MVCQYAEEDVRLGAVLELVEDRALRKRALHGTEGMLHPGEQNEGMPDLVGTEIKTIRLDHVAAVELLGQGFFVDVFAPRDAITVLDVVIPGDTGVTLLEPADRLVDLLRLLEVTRTRCVFANASRSCMRRFSCLARMALSFSFRPSLTREHVGLVSFRAAFVGNTPVDFISDNQHDIKYDTRADLTLYRVHPESRTLP